MNTETQNNALRERNLSFKKLLWISCAVIATQVIAGALTIIALDEWNDRSSFGEMFGSVNTLFSGLAFAGVIYAILLQRRELELQRHELEMTREELKRSATAQEESKQALQEQIRQNSIAHRGEILLTLIERYFDKEEHRQLYYRLDYGKFMFDPTNFPGSTDESALDGILYNLDVAGRMLKLGAISLDEASIFEFEAHRVLRNPQVREYFSWLHGEVRKLRIRSFPFENAEYLANRLLGEES